MSGRLKCLGRVEDRLQDVSAVVLMVFSLLVVLGLDVFLVWCALGGFWWVWPMLGVLFWVEVLFGFSLLVGWLQHRADDNSEDM
ncbi:hypothetical protein [uncultured Mobiluncus sp.]|uniref:hypothetical protein n=1 Tax=uncultured Mobiluncus sp. TaxID=293425 RepID=UPI0026389A24|nr:hypothetical protein [uncultured Mobiluncus sp.]